MNEDKLLRDTLIGATLLVVLVLMALFFALISGLQWYLDPDNALSITQRRDLVQGLASAGQAFAVFLTGAVGLIGLFFTWQNTRQARETSQRTLDLTEQGQITDRFTKAIDQLGDTGGEEDDKIEEIRLGGIYALEQIAVEQPDRYHWPIMQVFAAYLRRHASWQGDPARVITPAADIETVLHVIGHRSRYYGAGEDERLSLVGTDLSNYSFPAKAHLEGANLQNAHLESARLREAQLENADLRGAHLEGAYLWSADLRGADLGDTHLDATYLSQAKLQEAKHLDRNSLEKSNGDLSTDLGEVPKPTWWNNLPPDVELLPPGGYSIKFLSRSILHFSIPGEGWYSTLCLPYGLALTPAGASFTGSGLYIYEGHWVCDPHKPKEKFALVRPNPRNMVAFFDNHPYLTSTIDLLDPENTPHGSHGTQFEVETDPDIPDTEIDPGFEGPRVPIFPAYPRSHNYAVVKGKKNRVIVLEHNGEPLVIVVEAPSEEFDRFNERVEREVLPTLYWGENPSEQPEGS